MFFTEIAENEAPSDNEISLMKNVVQAITELDNGAPGVLPDHLKAKLDDVNSIMALLNQLDALEPVEGEFTECDCEDECKAADDFLRAGGFDFLEYLQKVLQEFDSTGIVQFVDRMTFVHKDNAIVIDVEPNAYDIVAAVITDFNSVWQNQNGYAPHAFWTIHRAFRG